MICVVGGGKVEGVDVAEGKVSAEGGLELGLVRAAVKEAKAGVSE